MTERTEEEVTVVTVAVVVIHLGTVRSGGRATRNVVRDVLDDVSLVLPMTATGRGAISNSRSPQAGKLLRKVVNFHYDPRWDHARLFLWAIDAIT